MPSPSRSRYLKSFMNFFLRQLQKCLTIDPNKRISSEQAIDDAYFREEPYPTEEYVIFVCKVFVV